MKTKRSQLWAAFFIFSVAWTAGLLEAAPSQEKVDTVRVVVRFARVLSLPASDSRIVKEFGYGTLLHVLGQSGDYFQVAALNAPSAQPGQPWYVLRSDVEAVSGAAAQALVENRRVTFMPEAPLAGQQVIFTASNFRRPSLLKWDMGDGTVLTSGGKADPGQDVTMAYSYAAAGKFLVKVFDEGGQTGSAPVSVQVTVSARARSLRVNPEKPLASQPVAITAVDFLTPDRIAWDLGDGTEIKPGDGPGVVKASYLISHVYEEEGSYTVKAYDSGGDKSQPPITVELQVKADPREIRVQPSKAVPGTELEFSAMHFNTPDDLRWDMGDGTLVPAKNEAGIRIGSILTYSYAKAGEYRVKVYDWNGDMDHRPVQLTVTISSAAKLPVASADPGSAAREGSGEPAAIVPAPSRRSPAPVRKKYNMVKIGPYAGYFQPRDAWLKLVYGKGDVLYGARLGIHIWNGFYIWLSGSQYKIISKTTFTEEKTTLTLLPLSAFLRYSLRLGFFSPYAGIGYTYMNFKEESAIGDTTGNGGNMAYEAGFELKMNRNFIMDLGVRYDQVKVQPTGFEVDLGGLQAGLSLLVSF